MAESGVSALSSPLSSFLSSLLSAEEALVRVAAAGAAGRLQEGGPQNREGSRRMVTQVKAKNQSKYLWHHWRRNSAEPASHQWVIRVLPRHDVRSAVQRDEA